MSVTLAKKKRKPAAEAPVLEKQALVKADRDELMRTPDTPVNPIDTPVLRSGINWNIIEAAYDRPKDVTGERGIALRAYFDAKKGPAVVQDHSNAVAMADYLAKSLEPRVITADKHPAKGSMGLFARVDIPAWTVLGMYGGLITSSARVITDHGPKAKCVRRGVDATRRCDKYIWVTTLRNMSKVKDQPSNVRKEFEKLRYGGTRKITPHTDLEILGLHSGNMLRFVNSYQGVVESDMRNTSAVCVWWKGLPRIVYLTRRAVPKDTELLVDYGDGFVLGGSSREEDRAYTDTDPNEMIVDAVLGHYPSDKPMYFKVQWHDGDIDPDVHVSALVEVDMSDPDDPFIFTERFWAYITEHGIPESLYRDKSLYTGTIWRRPPKNKREKKVEDKESSTSDGEEKALIAEPVDESQRQEKAVVAQLVSSKARDEMQVAKIRDMQYRGEKDGYFFDTLWANGTHSWEPTERFVTRKRDTNGRPSVVYDRVLLEFLKSRGITDTTAILANRVVAVRIEGHTLGKVRSRREPPNIVFRVLYSSGGVVEDVRLSQLISITYSANGDLEVRYMPILRDYINRLKADDEDNVVFMIESRIKAIMDRVQIVDEKGNI